jgi:hypothetical protein
MVSSREIVSGWWLASYISLWLLVAALVVVVLALADRKSVV